MNYFIIAALLVVFFIVIPFPIKIKGFFSLATRAFGVEFSIIAVDKSLSISMDAFPDKKEKKLINDEKEDKESVVKKINSRVYIDFIRRLRIDKITFSMLYGIKNDAMATALVCAGIDNALLGGMQLTFKNLYELERSIIPCYGKDECFVNLKLRFKLTVVDLIIYILINMKSFFANNKVRRG